MWIDFSSGYLTILCSRGRTYRHGSWGGADECIKGEFAANGVQNPLRHTKGVLSMARSQSFNSASSQFFICQADCTYLDGQYAAFGKVTEGIEVVDEIAKAETDSRDKPCQDIIIKSIRSVE